MLSKNVNFVELNKNVNFVELNKQQTHKHTQKSTRNVARHKTTVQYSTLHPHQRMHSRDACTCPADTPTLSLSVSR